MTVLHVCRLESSTRGKMSLKVEKVLPKWWAVASAGGCSEALASDRVCHLYTVVRELATEGTTVYSSLCLLL